MALEREILARIQKYSKKGNTKQELLYRRLFADYQLRRVDRLEDETEHVRSIPSTETASGSNLTDYSFASVLQSWFRITGIKQAELARNIGKPSGYISDLIHGRKDPRWTTIREIAQGLSISIVTQDKNSQP